MNIALGLWAYAAVLAVVGGPLLRRASWADRAPRLVVTAWQALTASIILAVAFGGFALVASTVPVSSSLAGWLEACAMSIRDQYATPGGALVATGGLIFALAVLMRWMYCLVTEFSRNRRIRVRHHEVLALIGRSGPMDGVTVVEHDARVVYCLAGRPHRVVMTSAATQTLDPSQLAAVLAHEHAHLRGRHDLAVAAAAATANAFGWLRVFQDARAEVTRLVELIADDRATRTSDRLTLAEAMLTLSDSSPPAGTFAAGGSTAAARVRRLIDGQRPLDPWASAVGLTAVITLVAVPLLALATPAATAGAACCTSDVHPSTMSVGKCDDARGTQCLTSQ